MAAYIPWACKPYENTAFGAPGPFKTYGNNLWKYTHLTPLGTSSSGRACARVPRGGQTRPLALPLPPLEFVSLSTSSGTGSTAAWSLGPPLICKGHPEVRGAPRSPPSPLSSCPCIADDARNAFRYFTTSPGTRAAPTTRGARRGHSLMSPHCRALENSGHFRFDLLPRPATSRPAPILHATYLLGFCCSASVLSPRKVNHKSSGIFAGLQTYSQAFDGLPASPNSSRPRDAPTSWRASSVLYSCRRTKNDVSSARQMPLRLRGGHARGILRAAHAMSTKGLSAGKTSRHFNATLSPGHAHTEYPAQQQDRPPSGRADCNAQTTHVSEPPLAGLRLLACTLAEMPALPRSTVVAPPRWKTPACSCATMLPTQSSESGDEALPLYVAADEVIL